MSSCESLLTETMMMIFYRTIFVDILISTRMPMDIFTPVPLVKR